MVKRRKKKALSKSIDLKKPNFYVDFTSYDGDAKGDLPEDYESKDFSRIKEPLKGPAI